MPDKLCCLCGGPIGRDGIGREDTWTGGYDAAPIAEGRCCRVCNDHVVVPERIRRLQQPLKRWPRVIPDKS